MPGSLQQAAPTSVFPNSLSTSFTLSLVYPILISPLYNDGTIHRSMVEDGVNTPIPLRTWHLSKLLTGARLTTLLAFWETTVFGGWRPFYFYDPFDPFPGDAIGSNYDATGVSTVGRATVHFRGNWGHTVQINRIQVPDITIVEVT